jgi:ribonuclease D
MPQKQYKSRRRWNSENYKQINIAVRPELAEAFRTACEQAHTPMREVFITLMTEYCAKPAAPKKQEDKSYTVRSKRRKATAAIIKHLASIRDAEEGYMQNMPANLRNSSRYESAEQAVEALGEAIDRLSEAFE